MPELVLSGFDELTKGMTIKVPSVLRKMAFNVDANVAAEGRRFEQAHASDLMMGQPQRKGNDGFRVRSKWDPDVGWVSTSRSAGKGGTGFRMASFGWERVRKGSVTAPYSNQLANLWHRPPKPYRADSPVVGRPGELVIWGAGSVRPVKYHWSQTYNILASMQDKAIEKTRQKFMPKLEEAMK